MRPRSTPIALLAVALVGIGCGSRGCCQGSECSPGFDFAYSPQTVDVSETAGIAVITGALNQNPRVHLVQVVSLSDFSSESVAVPPPPNFALGPFAFQDVEIAGTPTRAFWVGSGGVMILDVASMSLEILRQDVLSGTALGQVLALNDGSRVIVPVASTATNSNVLVMIEPSTLTINQVTLPGGYRVSSLSPSLSMDVWSDRLYVALENSAGVAELSLPDFTVQRSLSVGGVASDVQVGPDGSDLFVILLSNQRAYLPVAESVVDLVDGSVENACCLGATVATRLPDGRVLVVMRTKDTGSPLPSTIGILASDLQTFEALYPLAAE